jgi:antitoxin component YwqK of YwqJK toxin-antitoxin module
MSLSSIQIEDKNGIHETVSIKQRLKSFDQINFLAPQPYEKVIRIYKRKGDEAHLSKITSYHPNGHIHEYLEAKNGRAFGEFRSWHEKGTLSMVAHVIEGAGDLSPDAKTTWVFDGVAKVFDDQENVIALISYEKGKLQGTATYFYPTGTVKQTIPYEKDRKEGLVESFNDKGQKVGQEFYHLDQKEGDAFLIEIGGNSYKESYKRGKLIEGEYLSKEGSIIAEIHEGFGMRAIFADGLLKRKEQYEAGVQNGAIEIFSPEGDLLSRYHVKEGMKHGEEQLFYPKTSKNKGEHLKLSLGWMKDEVHGKVITWYENGGKESEREFSHNLKEGLAIGWYIDGAVMLVEEYEQDKLIKGKYFKRGESVPISQVIQGSGLVTLFDEEGNIMKKISYKNGAVVDD